MRSGCHAFQTEALVNGPPLGVLKTVERKTQFHSGGVPLLGFEKLGQQ